MDLGWNPRNDLERRADVHLVRSPQSGIRTISLATARTYNTFLAEMRQTFPFDDNRDNVTLRRCQSGQ